ncbi:MAG: cyclic nucleotide-binding domain-containing protein [Myxococcota bacterium]
MHREQRIGILRATGLFQGLGDQALLAIAAKLVERSFVRGAAVFRKGDPGDSLFLLSRGKVEIRDEAQRHLVTLTAPDVFGELAALSSEPRSADAVCAESVELLELKAADLQELMAAFPAVQRQVLLVLVHRVREAGARAGGSWR